MAQTRLPFAANLHTQLARGLDWVWPAGAAWAYSDALRHAPRSAELHFLLGRALERTNRWHEAARAYEGATAIEPTSLEYQGALVIALHQARREPALLEALRRLAQLRPGQAEIHVLIGAVLRRCGRKAEALRAFRLAVRLTAAPPARRFLLGEIVLGRDGWQETVVAWQQAQQMEGPGAFSPGQSALNFHPGRPLDQAPRRKASEPCLPARVAAAFKQRWSAFRSTCGRLHQCGTRAYRRGTRVVTQEQRLRALRRAWHKTHPRPVRRHARGGIT